ncbi:MAG TPA: DUF429 domain-containing protein [Candidatus Binataceae bacterium]|nr:DUF429 domain-containing protein [Candidatus Binataceae bacterium]
MRIDLRALAANDSGTSRAADAITLLAERLSQAAPELRGAIALVDSPRWPCDLDWSRPGVVPRIDGSRGRSIDVALRALTANLRDAGAASGLRQLAMFPTPALRYFGAHLNAPACKAHLQMLGRALFGEAVNGEFGQPAGGIFTRFMIAGFAVYRVLESIGAEAYEAYPDLQFRLWRGRLALPSKNSAGKGGKAAALSARVRILGQLRGGAYGCEAIRRMDEADAAILALSVVAARRGGATLVCEHRCEGRFIVALNAADARRLAALDSELAPA